MLITSKTAGGGREGRGEGEAGGKKGHSFWHRCRRCFSLFYGVKIMRLWSPRYAQWNDTIFEPPRSRARGRAPPAPCRLRSSIARQICSESTFTVPNTATSDCVLCRDGGERKTDAPPCAHVNATLCSSARRRFENHDVAATTRRVCIMRIKATAFLRRLS